MNTYHIQVIGSRQTDLRPGEAPVRDERVIPRTGVGDRPPAHDPVRDIAARFTIKAVLRTERRVHQRPEIIGRGTAAVFEFLDGYHVRLEPLKNPDARVFVTLLAARGDVRRHD